MPPKKKAQPPQSPVTSSKTSSAQTQDNKQSTTLHGRGYYLPNSNVIHTWNTKRLLPPVLLNMYVPFTMVFLILDDTGTDLSTLDTGLTDSVLLSPPERNASEVTAEYFSDPSRFQAFSSSNGLHQTDYDSDSINSGTYELGFLKHISAKIRGYNARSPSLLVPLSVKLSQLVTPSFRGVADVSEFSINMRSSYFEHGYSQADLAMQIYDVTQFFNNKSAYAKLFQSFNRYLVIYGWQGPDFTDDSISDILTQSGADLTTINSAERSIDLILPDNSPYKLYFPSPIIKSDGMFNFPVDDDGKSYLIDLNDLDNGNRMSNVFFGIQPSFSFENGNVGVRMKMYDASNGFQIGLRLAYLSAGGEVSQIRQDLMNRINHDIKPIATYEISSFFDLQKDHTFDADSAQGILETFYPEVQASSLGTGSLTEPTAQSEVNLQGQTQVPASGAQKPAPKSQPKQAVDLELTTQKIMTGIMQFESGGQNIPSEAPDSSAYGLYQVTRDTYNGNNPIRGKKFEDFKKDTAIQTQWMHDYTKSALSGFLAASPDNPGLAVKKTIMHHYYPAWVETPANWNGVPQAGHGNHSTLNNYYNQVATIAGLKGKDAVPRVTPDGQTFDSGLSIPQPNDAVEAPPVTISKQDIQPGGKLAKVPVADRLGDVITCILESIDSFIQDNINIVGDTPDGIKQTLRKIIKPDKDGKQRIDLGKLGVKTIDELSQSDIYVGGQTGGVRTTEFIGAIQQLKLSLTKADDRNSAQQLISGMAWQPASEVLGYQILASDSNDKLYPKFWSLLARFESLYKVTKENVAKSKVPVRFPQLLQKIQTVSFTWDDRYKNLGQGTANISGNKELTVADFPITTESLSRIMQQMFNFGSADEFITAVINAVSSDYGFALRVYHRTRGTQKGNSGTVQAIKTDYQNSRCSLYDPSRGNDPELIRTVIDDIFITEDNAIQEFRQKHDEATASGSLSNDTKISGNVISNVSSADINSDGSLDTQFEFLNNEYSSAKLNDLFIVDYNSAASLVKSLTLSPIDTSYALPYQKALDQLSKYFSSVPGGERTPSVPPKQARDIADNFTSLTNRVSRHLIDKYKLLPGREEFELKFNKIVSEIYDELLDKKTTKSNDDLSFIDDDIKSLKSKLDPDNKINQTERKQFLSQIVNAYLYNRPAGFKYAMYFGKLNMTIHGITGLGLMHGIYLRGILNELEGLYLISNITHKLGVQGFDTTLDAVYIYSNTLLDTAQLYSKIAADDENQGIPTTVPQTPNRKQKRTK